MIKHKEFKIKNKPNLLFRVANISPIDLLALQTQINFEDINQTKEVFTFILENVEVKILDNWVRVKLPGKEVYMPEYLEEDLLSLQQINMTFLSEILKPLFQKSSESNSKQE